MRFLAALLLCLFAFNPASAHVRHRHVDGRVQMIGYGIAHVLHWDRGRRHHVVRHHVALRHHFARRHYVHLARPLAMDAVFAAFEPSPASALFGAGQAVVDGAIGIGAGAALSALSIPHVVVSVTSHAIEGVINYRPRDCYGIAWCGCYMRHLLGVRDPSYNLARNWAHYGHPTSAHVGAIVVWPHHVGKIVGREHGEWVVLSGNDGHRVRERARSLRGAIAFRES